MVKFQKRMMIKTYKGSDYGYPIYSVNFPVELHEKVEAKLKKDFSVKWTEKETNEEEIINVTFTRKKLKNLLQDKPPNS